jgi:pyridoxal phosphate enzyme (YggS family)
MGAMDSHENMTTHHSDAPALRLAEIRRRMAAAEARSGRSPGSTRLVAICKTFPAGSVLELSGAGQRHFGENRVQEAVTKAAELTSEDLQWHLVGHLQRNKVRAAAGLFSWVHSVDSLDLAGQLSSAAVAGGRIIKVLVQVEMTGEPGRSGVAPAQLPELLAAADRLPGLESRGLMVLPPWLDETEEVRPYFRRLRKLAEQSEAKGLLPGKFDLSMGMSRDFEIAIEEGATLVRVGTALFGRREPVSR